jgi:hypothetical protein
MGSPLFRWFALVMIVAPVLAAGCAAPRSASPRDPFTLGAQATTEIQIRNRNWEAMAIYADRAGALVRLGIVEGLSERTFRIPQTQLTSTGEVQLVAETRISRQWHKLNGVTLSAGGILLCVLEGHLALSSVVVR